jgi:xylose isomerase
MSSKLRIGIRLWHTDSLEGKKGNVMGDELIARSWQKYMLRDERVESVSLYPGRGRVEEDSMS